MTIAWVFPGQGSQKLGMADLVLSLPGAIERFQLASQILGRDLLEICRGTANDPKGIEDLNDTRNTQPAIFVVESLLIDAIKANSDKPSLLAGHSLGELVALYAADVFNAEQALLLIHRRSELMAAAGGGAMTAVIGFDRNQLEELIKRTEGAFIANDNSSGQVVLSGTLEAIQAVTSSLNCKRAIPLQVSGAFHSPMMEEASREFEVVLKNTSFQNASIPVLSNSNPTPTCEGELLKDRLKNQMTNGVRWRETMDVMISQGLTRLIEIGPGNVLSGLAKRSVKGISIDQISSANDLGL